MELNGNNRIDTPGRRNPEAGVGVRGVKWVVHDGVAQKGISDKRTRGWRDRMKWRYTTYPYLAQRVPMSEGASDCALHIKALIPHT